MAADDPFVGTWKLNKEKSKLTGEQMKIEELADNKFKFSFGNESDTVTADGTDQAVLRGNAMSLFKETLTIQESGQPKTVTIVYDKM